MARHLSIEEKLVLDVETNQVVADGGNLYVLGSATGELCCFGPLNRKYNRRGASSYAG